MTASFFNVYPILTPVRLCSIVNVSGTYQNGSNGLYATLLVGGTSLSIDGESVENDDRVLLTGQTAQNQNGIYVVSGVGIRILLTRAPDFQNIEQLFAGQSVSISGGSTQAGFVFVLIDPLPGHFGNDPLLFISNGFTPLTNYPDQLVFVAQNGSDVTGDGTIVNPYLGINFAISTINDATVSKPYTVIVTSGRYFENNIVLKPSVNIQGLGFARVQINGVMSLDPAFADGTETITFFRTLILDIPGSVNFDISSNPASKAQMLFNTILLGGSIATTFDVKGGVNCESFVVFMDVLSFDPIEFNFENISAIIDDSVLGGNVTLLNSSNVASSGGFLLKSNFGPLLLKTTGTQILQSIMSANFAFASITVDGANSVLNIDVDSFQSVPTLVAGGTYNLTTIAEGLNANYTAVNYTPTGTHNDVKGNLEGIDNALGEVSASAILVAGTVVVPSTTVQVGSLIIPVAYDAGITGNLRITAITPGVSFTISSTVGGDAGEVRYKLYV